MRPVQGGAIDTTQDNGWGGEDECQARSAVRGARGLPAHWMLAALAVTALALSFCFHAGGLPEVPVCPFYALTGLPCPGCGLTRAFCCISHGELGHAWHLNPFGFLFYAFCIVLAVWPFLRRRTAWEQRLSRSRWSRVLPIALVAAMWSYGLWRIWAGG